MSWDDGWRLAPFYDLVCTRAYPQIDRRLAMAIAREGDPDRLRQPHFEGLARDVDVKPAWLVGVVRTTSERVLASLPDAVDASGVGRSPAVERIVPVVKKQARRLLRELGS